MKQNEFTVNINPPSILFVTVVLVALAIFFLGYAIWSASSQAHASLISISASGSLSAMPTQASIYVFLNASGADAASAVANLSVMSGRVNATLNPFLNGNSSLIQTTSYSVYQTSNCTNYPYYPYYPTTTIYCPSPLKFYVASEYILVTLPNVQNVNNVLPGLSGIAGVSINDVAAKLSSAQKANLSQEALTLALNNATSQAQALSNGRQLEIRNITVANNYIYYAASGGFTAPAAVSNQTFFPGSATVTKSIYVVFNTR